MRVLLFGGTGTLGQQLRSSTMAEFICPSSQKVDITYLEEVDAYMDIHKPDLVINAAAVIDNRILESQPEQAIRVNILGAANVAMACIKHGARLVYISTDYVYKGDRGNYSETDELLPYNFYAWTKLGGEASVRGVKNHLIIRTSFGKTRFPYPQAFMDKWSSKDYVDIIAPLILEAALSPLTGVLNLGTDRKTLYDYAVVRNPDVLPVKVSETSYFSPYDSSLNTQRWINYKGDKPAARPHTKCRACGSDNMKKYLDLGMMPLSNNLGSSATGAKAQERFPLQVMFCQECGLSQLSVVIDPGKMYNYYTYRSGINAGYITHCISMAKDLMTYYTYESDYIPFVVDIAGNDGTLLKQFKRVMDCKVLNVDPASNLVAIAEAQGIPSLADFWSTGLAQKIADQYGKADTITATNVFAHVNDVVDFLQAAAILLSDRGILVLEFPYLIDFIEDNEFDTVYFEHLSYMSISPIDHLCKKIGSLRILDVVKQDIHGGTVRVILSKTGSEWEEKPSVKAFLQEEERYNTETNYIQWGFSVQDFIRDFSKRIRALKIKGHRIAAFAASAKGNTLLNSAGISTDVIDFIVDETPEKVGKFSPGTGIPIVYKQELSRQSPDYLVILSWNFKEEIMAKAVDAGFTGKFIIPLPVFKIIEQL